MITYHLINLGFFFRPNLGPVINFPGYRAAQKVLSTSQQYQQHAINKIKNKIYLI